MLSCLLRLAMLAPYTRLRGHFTMPTYEAVGTATRTSSHVKVVIAEIRDISERPRRFLSAGVKRPVRPFIRTARNRTVPLIMCS
jgi:hypothetical protein